MSYLTISQKFVSFVSFETSLTIFFGSLVQLYFARYARDPNDFYIHFFSLATLAILTFSIYIFFRSLRSRSYLFPYTHLFTRYARDPTVFFIHIFFARYVRDYTVFYIHIFSLATLAILTFSIYMFFRSLRSRDTIHFGERSEPAHQQAHIPVVIPFSERSEPAHKTL